MPHEHHESDQVKPLQDLSQPLLVASHPAEPAHPADIPLDHPATRQQHETAFGLRQRDDLAACAAYLLSAVKG